jgi:hypothetical protein
MTAGQSRSLNIKGPCVQVHGQHFGRRAGRRGHLPPVSADEHDLDGSVGATALHDPGIVAEPRGILAGEGRRAGPALTLHL